MEKRPKATKKIKGGKSMTVDSLFETSLHQASSPNEINQQQIESLTYQESANHKNKKNSHNNYDY